VARRRLEREGAWFSGRLAGVVREGGPGGEAAPLHTADPSPHTLHTHTQSALNSLNAHSRQENVSGVPCAAVTPCGDHIRPYSNFIFPARSPVALGAQEWNKQNRTLVTRTRAKKLTMQSQNIPSHLAGNHCGLSH
jgi:hypothetical protein